MGRRKPRKCRICKKSPVWRGGDVKDPGPFCKKCYHKHVSPGRPGGRQKAAQPQQELQPIPEEFWMDEPDQIFYTAHELYGDPPIGEDEDSFP